MAPVVGPLPAVIVGGADTVDQATNDVHLLRYVNVFNLADPGVITRRTNPDDSSKLAVWYSVSGTSAATLKVSNTAALVAPITVLEAASLTSQGLRAPIASRQINTASDQWLSLIEDAPGAGKTHAQSAVLANVNNNGASSASLQAVVGKKTIVLYAIDPAVAGADTNAVGAGAFDVYSLLLQKDGLSPRTNVASGTSGWVSVSGPGRTGTAGGAIGFTGQTNLTTKGYVYSTWGTLVPAVGTDVVNPLGMIYEVKATMTGSATNAFNTPGFRLFFIANAGVHSGGMQFMSKSPGFTGTDSNIPKTGSPKECRIYWAAPRDLTDMADGGFLGAARAYGVQFDMIQEEATDAGSSIMMSGFNLDLIPRPVNVAAAKTWADGSNGSVTMAPGTDPGWSASGTTAAGYDAGNVTVGQSNITFSMGATNSAYKGVNILGFTGLPAWTTGKLVRTTYQMSTGANNVPAFRLLTMFATASPFAYGQLITIDNFNFDVVRAANKPSNAHPILSGTPKLAGSTVETYCYEHTGVASAVVFPQVDIVQTDRSTTKADGTATNYSSNWNGWGKPGSLVINSIGVEILNP